MKEEMELLKGSVQRLRLKMEGEDGWIKIWLTETVPLYYSNDHKGVMEAIRHTNEMLLDLLQKPIVRS